MMTLRALHWPGGAATNVSDIALAVALGLAAALALGSLLALLLRQHGSVRRAALEALSQMHELPVGERAVAQARLLRRLVLTLRGEAAARQQGTAWLEQLDRTFRTHFFTRGAGRYYVDGLYQDGENLDATAIDRELTKLFQRIRR